MYFCRRPAPLPLTLPLPSPTAQCEPVSMVFLWLRVAQNQHTYLSTSTSDDNNLLFTHTLLRTKCLPGIFLYFFQKKIFIGICMYIQKDSLHPVIIHNIYSLIDTSNLQLL